MSSTSLPTRVYFKMNAATFSIMTNSTHQFLCDFREDICSRTQYPLSLSLLLKFETLDGTPLSDSDDDVFVTHGTSPRTAIMVVTPPPNTTTAPPPNTTTPPISPDPVRVALPPNSSDSKSPQPRELSHSPISDVSIEESKKRHRMKKKDMNAVARAADDLVRQIGKDIRDVARSNYAFANKWTTESILRRVLETKHVKLLEAACSISASDLSSFEKTKKKKLRRLLYNIQQEAAAAVDAGFVSQSHAQHVFKTNKLISTKEMTQYKTDTGVAASHEPHHIQPVSNWFQAAVGSADPSLHTPLPSPSSSPIGTAVALSSQHARQSTSSSALPMTHQDLLFDDDVVERCADSQAASVFAVSAPVSTNPVPAVAAPTATVAASTTSAHTSVLGSMYSSVLSSSTLPAPSTISAVSVASSLPALTSSSISASAASSSSTASLSVSSSSTVSTALPSALESGELPESNFSNALPQSKAEPLQGTSPAASAESKADPSDSLSAQEYAMMKEDKGFAQHVQANSRVLLGTSKQVATKMDKKLCVSIALANPRPASPLPHLNKLKPLWIHWCCVRSAFDFHWPNFQLAVLESVRRCVLSIIGTYEDATAHPLHSKLSSFFTKLDDYDLLWDTTRKARDFQDENLIATVDAIYCYLEEHGQLPSQNRGSSSSSRPTVLQYLKACGMQLGKRSRSIEQLCAVLLRADLVNADVPLSDFRSLLLCLLARAVNGIAKVPVVSQWCLSEVGTIVDSKCAELLQRKLASASTKRRRQAKTKGAVTKSSSKRSRLR